MIFRRPILFNLFTWLALATFPAYSAALCGNSLIEAAEQCDDGNLINGDGCSSICIRESLPPITGSDVIDNFTTPRTFTDGLSFGACNALTVETSGSPSLSVVNNSYLLATVPAIADAFIIRTTNPLPPTYKVTVDIGDIEFDLINLNDFENGFYLPTITAVPGSPTINDWWHLNRKVHIDIDNNFWGWGGSHPVFVGYYDPSSLTAPDPSYGQLVYDQSTNSWVEINTNWASIFNYQKSTWYTFEIEKTTSTYFFRIFNAFTHVKLREASIPISNVRSGADYLAIGDPHTNYYNGSAKIANLRITNLNCNSMTAPVITQQPQSASVFVGQNAAFSVTATGIPAPTYQWQSKTSGAPSFANISGATASSYTFTNAQLSNSGTQFQVVVTNSSGTVTSNPVTLTVSVAPVAPNITTQPQNASVFVGQNAAFSVTATGTPAPTYQWQSKASGAPSFANITGAIASSYPFANAQLSNSGTQLRVVVTNSSGTVTSNAATLTVTVAPVAPSISAQPQNASVFVGQNAAFSVTATGTPAPSYQWQSKASGAPSFSNISGATSSSYTLAYAQLSNSGTQFQVVVTNSSGTVTSNAATLTVTVAPVAPSITTQPQNASVFVGQNAAFSVTAAGIPAPTYQWQSKAAGAPSFTNITGATASNYTFTNAQLSNSGTQFQVVVTNSSGTVTSNAATLTVTVAPIAPSITTQPQNASVFVGQNAALSVTATGTPAPTYQWQSQTLSTATFINITGATSSSYTFTNAQLSDNSTQFRVVITNSSGTVISNAALLTVNTLLAAPTITQQPSDASIAVGQSATFKITATGSPAPTYQWQSKAINAISFSNIVGATSSTYTWVNAQLSANGTQLRCIVANTIGTVISRTVYLVVRQAPLITTQPKSTSTLAGQSAAFNITATGNPIPTYQWQLKTPGATSFTNIVVATSSTYTWVNVQLSHSGTQLRCIASNNTGTIISNTATLTVIQVAPLITAQPQSINVFVNQNAAFSIMATGSPTPTYQWQSHVFSTTTFTNIPGATSSDYTFTNAQLSDNGTQFRVVVSNSTGTVTSNTATLTVTLAPAAPVITTQPESASVFVGQDAAFSVAATGTPAPMYQWQLKASDAPDFTDISGATASSYTFTNAQLSNNATQLRVVVTNSSGAVTSNVATLTVSLASVAPLINAQPLNASIYVGQSATFSVTATGTPAPTYQWQSKASGALNFTDISGATSSSYTFTSAQLSNNATQLRVVATNSSGTVTSNVATLTVTAAPKLPVITGFWQRNPVYVGQIAAFSVTSTGIPTPTYQWQSKIPGAASFTNIAGATNFNILWPNAKLSDNGTQLRVLATNSSGTATSMVATLIVNNYAPPVISTQPLDKSVILGQNALFRVTATGSPAPTYQWQSQTPSTATFTNIAGATSSSYTFTNALLSDNGTQFRVVVKNSTGTVISNVATLTVTASTLPVISAQPQNKTVIVGQGALFSVSATGSPAPTYQWQSQFFSTASFTNIPGATAASYTFANAQLSHNNAQFRVLVTNSSGTVISNAATLTVTTSFAPASVALVAPDFSNIRVFPNPWRADRHTGTTITFDNLTFDSTVRIFTVSGYLVKTLSSTNGSVTWDLTTSGGDRAASGLYIYLITAGDRSTRGKLAIIK